MLVSHLRRVAGNEGHENGVEVNLSHLRGSQSIAQISDCVIALERNQQADDPIESNTTKLRVLKSRYTGDVGLACSLFYDVDTGRLSEVQHETDNGDLEFDNIPFQEKDMSDHYREVYEEKLYEKALDMGMSEAEALAYVKKTIEDME